MAFAQAELGRILEKYGITPEISLDNEYYPIRSMAAAIFYLARAVI